MLCAQICLQQLLGFSQILPVLRWESPQERSMQLLRGWGIMDKRSHLHEQLVERLARVGPTMRGWDVTDERPYLHKELVKRLAGVVLPELAGGADGVDLVDEHNAGRLLLGRRKECAHAPRAHAHKHLLELAARPAQQPCLSERCRDALWLCRWLMAAAMSARTRRKLPRRDIASNSLPALCGKKGAGCCQAAL